MKLSELYGFTKKAKKLSTNDLKNLIAEVMNEKADPGKVEDDRFPMNLSSVDQEFASRDPSSNRANSQEINEDIRPHVVE